MPEITSKRMEGKKKLNGIGDENDLCTKYPRSRFFGAERTDVMMQCDWLNLPVATAAGSSVVGPARHPWGKGGVSHK